MRSSTAIGVDADCTCLPFDDVILSTLSSLGLKVRFTKRLIYSFLHPDKKSQSQTNLPTVQKTFQKLAYSPFASQKFATESLILFRMRIPFGIL